MKKKNKPSWEEDFDAQFGYYQPDRTKSLFSQLYAYDEVKQFIRDLLREQSKKKK
jgi:hypothetical protein